MGPDNYISHNIRGGVSSKRFQSSEYNKIEMRIAMVEEPSAYY